MKAIVCGAGISGLTMAQCLARQGWQVLLLEKAPQLRGQGYMIDFFGSGWDAADRLGLLPDICAARYPVEEILWINTKGRTTARIDYRLMSRLLDGKLASLTRGDLEQILFRHLPGTVDLRFGCSVSAFVDTPDGVMVRLSSGVEEKADVLVGADGVHSEIRRMLFGQEEKFFRYLGFHTAAFVFDDPVRAEELGGEFKMMSAPGRQAGFYPLRGGRVATFFVHAAPDMTLPDDPVAELNRVYGDLPWMVPAALQAAAKLDRIYYDQVAQVDMPHWAKGHVALIGDAAMAVSLLAGQGASMGMASAYILANELERHEVGTAVRRYEDRLQADVRKKQEGGRQTAKWLVPAGAWQIFLRDFFMRLANLPLLSGIFMRMFLSGSESVLER